MDVFIWLLFMLLLSQCAGEKQVTEAENAPANAISFEIEGPKEVQLPLDSLQLKIVFNPPRDTSNLTYYWEVLEGASFAATKTKTTYMQPILTLVNLKEGKMRWRATVKEDDSSSSRDCSINILPPKQPNRPPKVHINPASPVHAIEGSEVVLDAEGSSDEDGGPLDFEWQLIKGPSVVLPATNTAVLRLDTLSKGNYTFGLTVKDKQGAEDHGTVDVIVSAKRDDPPKAQISDCNDLVPRSSIDVRLPLKTLLLCANKSSDDYGIDSYKWFRVDNLTSQLAVDFTGSTTPVLSLTNLQPNENVGPYVFLLTVFDANRQNDSAKISIMVNKAINQAPVPYAGSNQTVPLPVETVVLTGSVKDDGQIVSYEWTQLKGPSDVEFLNQDKIKCTVKGFQEGLYQFQLNVTDDGGLSATSETFVNITNSKNEPPVARAQNVTVHLPSNLVVLNGNESSDDAGIVAYLWTPHGDVPACISMLGDSYNKPQLLLGGLVPGRFFFDLTVMDHSDAQNMTTVVLTVLPGEELTNSVEMYINENEASITYTLRGKLQSRIGAAVNQQIAEDVDVVVDFSEFAQEPRAGKLRVVFSVKAKAQDLSRVKARDVSPPTAETEIISGQKVVSILRREANMIQEFHIESIDTLFCMLDCSGHGACSNFSKQCSCDRYWMPNLFHYFVFGGAYDCSWSMLYFGIAVLVFMFLLPKILWCLICRRTNGITKWNDVKRAALRRRKRKRFRRNGDDTTLTVLSGNGKANDQSSSYSLLIGSDSLSSDTEIDRMKNDEAEKKKEELPVNNASPGTDLRERTFSVPLD